MASNPALDGVLAAAQSAAENFQAPAVVPQNGNLPAASNDNRMGALSKPTMEGFLSGSGMTCDEYLVNKAEGFRIGKEMKGLLEEIEAELDLMDVVPVFVSRHETAGQTKFLKSYDGETTPNGQNFQYAYQAECARNQNNTEPYKTVEIPVTLTADVKDPKSGLVIHEGTIVGITPSLTGFTHFQKFHKKLLKANPANADATVKVKITHTKRTNSKNNEWGVCDFELI
jgi:hypothetical protein